MKKEEFKNQLKKACDLINSKPEQYGTVKVYVPTEKVSFDVTKLTKRTKISFDARELSSVGSVSYGLLMKQKKHLKVAISTIGEKKARLLVEYRPCDGKTSRADSETFMDLSYGVAVFIEGVEDIENNIYPLERILDVVGEELYPSLSKSLAILVKCMSKPGAHKSAKMESMKLF